MKDPVKACEQIAATIGKDGVDALAASSGNSELLMCEQYHAMEIKHHQSMARQHYYVGMESRADTHTKKAELHEKCLAEILELKAH